MVGFYCNASMVEGVIGLLSFVEAKWLEFFSQHALVSYPQPLSFNQKHEFRRN